MLDLAENVIIIDGRIRTYEIDTFEPDGNRYTVTFRGSSKVYRYGPERLTWLRNPLCQDIGNCHVFIKGKRDRQITSVKVFNHFHNSYYAVSFQSGFVGQYDEKDIEIRRSCLSHDSLTTFEYFRDCARLNKLGIPDEEKDENIEGILSAIYSRIDFIDERTAAAVYIDRKKDLATHTCNNPIFPFGCNASQCKAVRAALSNQLSVIQGPPGTGKTQTILNIIANLLIAGKSVLVVSNNNSATDNVIEKLAKNGLDFLVAPLGKRENKELFIAKQPQLNPDLPTWHLSRQEKAERLRRTEQSRSEIEAIFDAQEKLALFRQELADVILEKQHFEQDHPDIDTDATNIRSEKIMRLLSRLQKYAAIYLVDQAGWWKKVKGAIRKFELEFTLRRSLQSTAKLSEETIPDILTEVEYSYYICRANELQSEIGQLEARLSKSNAASTLKTLSDTSMSLLKAALADRYSEGRVKIANSKDLYKLGEDFLKEFPIVTSTTFSAKLCLSPETLYDYVIMDEASQVPVETGFLALSCAKNAVIVGDRKQLPNVISEEDALKLAEVKRIHPVAPCYDCANENFLGSILSARPTIPETMLREHYRCHPDIINFCNQKFYDGKLLIMTERHNGDEPLIAVTTAEGHHARRHYNQREIDCVKLELLPKIENQDDIGIIAPYNRQVDSFRVQLPQIETATVHKFQGREKSTIIMSVTDDEITEFTDNANLLNVAVSRAKDKFCLVVTGNQQQLEGNIHDLIGYIRYRKGTIIESRLHSIFDYLYSNIAEFGKLDGNVSEYESENLTYTLIEKIKSEHPSLSHTKVLPHYPMRNLIKDTSSLTERERKYARHPATHIDSLIINRVTKEPVLAIETDGYNYHNERTDQAVRDKLKDHILDMYGLPLLRLSTIGHSEYQRIADALLKSH